MQRILGPRSGASLLILITIFKKTHPCVLEVQCSLHNKRSQLHFFMQKVAWDVFVLCYSNTTELTQKQTSEVLVQRRRWRQHRSKDEFKIRVSLWIRWNAPWTGSEVISAHTELDTNKQSKRHASPRAVYFPRENALFLIFLWPLAPLRIRIALHARKIPLLGNSLGKFSGKFYGPTGTEPYRDTWSRSN